MRQHTATWGLLLVGGALVLGLVALAWTLGGGSSEAQQDAMHNCPQAGKWAISVWSGDDGTETGQALGTCGEQAVAAAYYIDPQTGIWSRWFAGRPGASNLQSLGDMQGLIALGTAGPAPPTATPTSTPTETETPTGTPPPIPGCTHHVATTGDDGNSGTAEAPWRTIQQAADTSEPGDAVCIHSGTYSEEVTFTHSGTAEAPITFTAAPGETVTVQHLFLTVGTSYLQLIGFTVRGFSDWGVDLDGDNHHIFLSHLDVAGGGSGVGMESGDDGLVSDVILEDSVIGDHRCWAVSCGPRPCDRLTFRRLEIYGSGIECGSGGDALAVEQGQDILVEDCYVHDNYGDGIDLNSRDEAGNVAGIVVRRNRVVRNHLNGIKLFAGGQVENNVVWGQGVAPVWLGDYPGPYEVVNNTIAYNMYSTDFGWRDYAFVAGYADPDTGASAAFDLTLVNNIFAFNTGPEVALDAPTGIYLGPRVQLTEHHNLYWSRDDGEIEAQFVSGRSADITRA